MSISSVQRSADAPGANACGPDRSKASSVACTCTGVDLRVVFHQLAKTIAVVAVAGMIISPVTLVALVP